MHNVWAIHENRTASLFGKCYINRRWDLQVHGTESERFILLKDLLNHYFENIPLVVCFKVYQRENHMSK